MDWLVEAEEEDSRRGQEFSQVQIFQYVFVKINQSHKDTTVLRSRHFQSAPVSGSKTRFNSDIYYP